MKKKTIVSHRNYILGNIVLCDVKFLYKAWNLHKRQEKLGYISTVVSMYIF